MGAWPTGSAATATFHCWPTYPLQRAMELEEPASSAAQALSIDKRHVYHAVRDSLAGINGAAAKMLLGHPFDTIKVRMQACEGNRFRTLFGSVRSTLLVDGPLGFYRGLSVTVPGLFVYNTVLFSFYGFACDVIRIGSGSPTSQLSQREIATAGALAGAAANVIHSPFEYVRCRLQASPPTQASLVGTMRAVYRSSGFAGLYRGLHLTLAREVPANALYFSTFEYLVPPYVIAIAGGLAGIANWMFVFPIDTIKSRWQTDSLTSPKYASVLDCIRQTYLKERWSGFWRGLSSCLTRAFVANSATFVAVEATQRILNSRSNE
ncbi:unnamed protein product (mitochondrion) [Plasmodiophora brassicae]|uniref:Mitochondrial carrier protein n=1 Tax=Plasmodiophora brassicae TaxID=37360 RepID=A0A3P3Y3W8_PLABS|nr:unnamed protein product [Plasmodiophora brassicae]